MRLRPVLLLPALLLAATAAAAAPLAGDASPAPVDPRAGGFAVAMGEWTLVPEAMAIRPGASPSS